MANRDKPCGARVYGKLKSATHYVSGAAVYPGDFVKLDNTGRVVAASAGDTLLGVCLEYASAAGVRVSVSDHPEQLYVLQADEADIDAQTDVGNVADILATAASATYKISRHEMDSSTIATGGSAQLVLMDIEQRPDNAFGATVDCIVKINEHQLVNGFAGI